jgi:hypothetical protein
MDDTDILIEPLLMTRATPEHKASRNLRAPETLWTVDAGAWLEVLQNLMAAMHIPHRIVIGAHALILDCF